MLDADPKVIQQINFTGNLILFGMNFIWYQNKTTDYQKVNVMFSDSQLKSAAKNATGITLRLLADMIGINKDKFPT